MFKPLISEPRRESPIWKVSVRILEGLRGSVNCDSAFSRAPTASFCRRWPCSGNASVAVLRLPIWVHACQTVTWGRSNEREFQRAAPPERHAEQYQKGYRNRSSSPCYCHTRAGETAYSQYPPTDGPERQSTIQSGKVKPAHGQAFSGGSPPPLAYYGCILYRLHRGKACALHKRIGRRMSSVSEGEPIRHFRLGLGVPVWIPS
jgi:hypothetical protein